MKYIWLFVLICCVGGNLAAKEIVSLLSPNGKIEVKVRASDKIYYDIFLEGNPVLENNVLSLTLRGETLGLNPVVRKVQKTQINEELHPVVPLKYATVANRCAEAFIQMKGNWGIRFRAYDDGVAYRFVLQRKGEVEVLTEEMNLNVPDDCLLHLQQPGGFKTSYEEAYTHVACRDWKTEKRLATLPALFETADSVHILISEADLHDYPCLFLTGDKERGITSAFPKVPLEFGEDGDRSLKILQEADYIARTSGKRDFPWRYFVVTADDKVIVENTMNCRLSGQSKLEDVSWIHPGQVSWEWWNGASPYGDDVNFVSGFNLNTYKYYIDFAAKHGIPYILLDEGWAASTYDPYTPNPEVDVHELIRYGKEKNVGIVLWLTWLCVDRHPELFAKFHEWGVKGVKIDFMDRSDQWMVNFYERVARAAAENHILVDFHGSFKPAGLEYKYPNVLSYEGVRGMEQMQGCTPDNSLYFPFMRNAVGAMDYTPGAMISMQPEVYSGCRPNSSSIGTRAYQLALYVVFESGLQMLADNPTLYYRNEDCTRFITDVPVTWDETKVLAAEVGKYVIVAKRKAGKWYIGGITNNEEKERNFSLNFDFLPEGKQYKMTLFEDGINAGHQAMDYRKKEITVKRGDKLSVKMVRNGGMAAVLE